MVDCANCIEKCPQAAAANEIAKGRMFAEREFINLINKIENGTLVEVVRCGECKHTKTDGMDAPAIYCKKWDKWEMPNDFYCKYGERKGGNE